jgi:hypothetical protein
VARRIPDDELETESETDDTPYVFGDNINSNFKRALAARKKGILQRVGTDIVQSYEQILEWRNEFAHTGRRNTTIEEAMRTHVFAKRVMFAFSDAFV